MESAFLKGKVAALLRHTLLSVRAISRETQVPRRTVRRWIGARFQLERHRGAGRPSKFTDRARRHLHRLVSNDPTLSGPEITVSLGMDVHRTTVWRHLKRAGFNSFKRGSKFHLTERHKQARLHWAMARAHWRLPAWRRIVFSDEASVKLMARDGRLRVWLRAARHRRNEFALPLVQGGGGGVLIWGAIWMGGRSELYITRQSMNSERYVELLEQFVYPISFQLGDPATQWRFMDDNAPPHRSRVAQAFKTQSGIRSIDWPARSPDLNPIENLWSWMKMNVRKQIRPGDTLNRLELVLRQSWLSIPQQSIDNLIEGMPKRLRETIESHGNHSSY